MVYQNKGFYKVTSILVSLVFLFTIFFPLGLLGSPQVANAANFDVSGQDVIPGEIIIKYKPGTKGISGMAAMGIQQMATSSGDVHLYSLRPGQDLAGVLAELNADPAVEFAEPNIRYSIASATVAGGVYSNDPMLDHQWGLDNINVADAWQAIARTTGSVTVAVIDTGTDATHEDLVGRVLEGRNFAQEQSDGTPYPDGMFGNEDDHSHGTMVASVIAAVYNNGIGIAGAVGPGDVKILPVKVLNDRGSGSSFDVAQGIRYAADQRVAIINLSLGGSYSQAVADAVDYAQRAGVLVIAAAGNGSADVNNFFPAALPGVLTVGAIAGQNQPANFTNWGAALEIMAPGENIRVATPGDQYTDIDGTSFSAPFVAAAAAMYKLANPGATSSDIFTAIAGGASDLGDAGWDETFGYGKLDALATLLPQPDPEIPVVKFSTPKDGSNVMGETEIIVEVLKDADQVDKVKFYLNENLLKEIPGVAGQSLYAYTWDASDITDGSYTLLAVASAGATVKGQATVDITVRNAPQSGLMLEILDPAGNKAPGANIVIYKQVAVDCAGGGGGGCAGCGRCPRAAKEIGYQQIWSGAADGSGVLRVPPTLVQDLDTLFVLVQGEFDGIPATAGEPGLEKGTLFMYSRTLEGPGVFKIDGTDTVPVTLEALNKNGNQLAEVSYFASPLDQDGVVIGTSTALNELHNSTPVVYMDKGKYNLFAHSETTGAVYFLNKYEHQVSAEITLTFDGRDTGEVVLASELGAIRGAVLYLYNEATDEALGLDNVLIGDRIRVTAGEYLFWADVEIEDPAGGENWVYILGTLDEPITVTAEETTRIWVGGKVTLDQFEPDLEALQAYWEDRGEYTPPVDPHIVCKSNRFFFTQHSFTDSYGNSMVGLYRGTLAGEGLWLRTDLPGTGLVTQRLATNNDAWQAQDHNFGDIHPYFKVTRQSDGEEMYHRSFRSFYWRAFWAIGLARVTGGQYDLQLTLQDNPLAGSELTKSMVVTVTDENHNLFVTDATAAVVRPFIFIFRVIENEDGAMKWERAFGSWGVRSKTDPNFGMVSVGANIELSEFAGGNVAAIQYLNADREWVFIKRQFNEFSDLDIDPATAGIQVAQANPQKVVIEATDEMGETLPLISRKSKRAVVFLPEVNGQTVPFKRSTGCRYTKEAVWLEPGTYHIDGRYVIDGTGDYAGKKINYYLIEKDVTISDVEGVDNTVTLDGSQTARIAIEVDHEGYHDFRGVALFPYQEFAQSFCFPRAIGHVFHVPAGIETDLVIDLALGDPENPAHLWNYAMQKDAFQDRVFEKGERVTWQLGGDFSASLVLDDTSIRGNENLSGTVAITDQFDNQLISSLVDNWTGWGLMDFNDIIIAESATVRQIDANGQMVEVANQDYLIMNDSDMEIAGRFSIGINPYLRVYQRGTGDQETRVFNQSKAEYFSEFSERLSGVSAGSYRAEIAFAAGPGGPIATPNTDGLFTLTSRADRDCDRDGGGCRGCGGCSGGGRCGGGGGGGGAVAEPGETTEPTEPVESVKDETVEEALAAAINVDAATVSIDQSEATSAALTLSQLNSIENAGKSLEMVLEHAAFTLPTGALGLADMQGVNNVEFSAEALAKTEAEKLISTAENAAVIKLAGQVFELNITAIRDDGKNIVLDTFNKPVEVTLAVPADARAAALAGELKIHRYNPATNRWDFVGGKYDAKTNTITFETKRFSKFAMLITDEIMQIATVVFADIAGHWAKQDIQFMAENGYVKGVSENQFAPNANVTRAQFAALMGRVLGLDEDQSATTKFSDLSNHHWAYGAVQSAAQAGLVGGYQDGTFRPNQNITRQEMAAMISRALAYKGVKTTVTADEASTALQQFHDRNQVAAWAKEAAVIGVKNELIKGRSANEYAPLANATRAESVVILKRLLEK